MNTTDSNWQRYHHVNCDFLRYGVIRVLLLLILELTLSLLVPSLSLLVPSLSHLLLLLSHLLLLLSLLVLLSFTPGTPSFTPGTYSLDPGTPSLTPVTPSLTSSALQLPTLHDNVTGLPLSPLINIFSFPINQDHTHYLPFSVPATLN